MADTQKKYWEQVDYIDPAGQQIPIMPKMYTDYFAKSASDLPEEKRAEIWNQWYLHMTDEEKAWIQKMLQSEITQNTEKTKGMNMDQVAAMLKGAK